MADTKLSALTALTGANVATGDLFVAVDVSATEAVSITYAELAIALGTLGIRGVFVSAAGKVGTTGGALTFTGSGVSVQEAFASGNAGAFYAGTIIATSSVLFGSTAALDGNGLSLGSAERVLFSSNTDYNGASDLGAERAAAGVGRITAGTSGIGALLHSVLVEASTAGSGAPNLLAATESKTVLTNEGATAENYHTLPSAAAGMAFTFVVIDTDGIRIVANTADTVTGSTGESGAAGFIRCATIGASITLVAINATQWVPTSIIGTWTVDV